MKQHIQSIAIGAALITLGSVGCGDDPGPLDNVDAIVILQRGMRNDAGDVFQYASYRPGGRLVELRPPSADGKLTTLCCDETRFPELKAIDIQGYDISFDAKTIVFAGRLGPGDDQKYGLYLLELANGNVTQLGSDPMRHYVSPIFLPGDKILFTTTDVVEKGTLQHVDEYERGETIQMGRMNIDGTGKELGPRNLSHRTAPSLTSEGRVIFTQWDHLGRENSGHLMFMNADMQELREAFGKERTEASNSTLKAREISPGRFVAIATSRSRTLQAGALIDIRLGNVETHNGVVSAPTNQSEANATFHELTPNVPRDGMPSPDTVGRYYDAFPLNAKDKPDLLVSWSNGPVETAELALGGVDANFGIFLYNSQRQQRLPIFDDPTKWDVFARPLVTRTAPNVVASAQDPKLNGETLIGSLNVYDSSLHTFQGVPGNGEIYGVRVMEGYSSEEGFYPMFGTTMFEGQTNLGVAPVANDGSWSAKIPANVPVHLQAVDKFGMSLFNEPVWFSGRPGEARMCGGCHESRTKTTNVSPGLLDTFATGATEMFGSTPRRMRLNTAPVAATDIRGVGWSTQVQPIFDAKCIGCHDGTARADGANPEYTITDKTTGNVVLRWRFNLKGDALPAEFAAIAGGAAYSASYFSAAGPDMEAIEKGDLLLSKEFKVYLNPEDARRSIMITKLNPTQLFPVDLNTRAFTTTAHLLDPSIPGMPADLSSKDFYMLILAADMGVNFYARENRPLPF